MFNVGIDFAFFGSRLSGSLEFYNKKTSDLIWYYPVSTNIYPVSTMTANVGDITNRGVELTLNVVPVQTEGLHLDHNA